MIVTGRWAVPALMLLWLAACGVGGDSPGPAPTTTDPRLRGTIVAETQQGRTVVFEPLPDGEPAEVALPDWVEFAPQGVPIDGGLITVAFGEERGALLRVDAAGEVRPLIPRIGDATTLSVRAGMAAVGDCARRALLIVPVDGGRVRQVGGACFGALSPDGRSVAWIRDGVAYRGPVSGSTPPERWFAISEVGGLDDVIPRAGRVTFEMTWGEPGLAVVVGTEEDTAVVVIPESGSPGVVDTLDASRVSFLQWQPNGPLLAVATGRSGGEGFVRLYDPRDASLTTVGLHPRGFLSASWAPDGRSLVALTGAGFIGEGPGGYRLFVDLEGTQFARTRGTGGFLYGWGP